MSKTILLDLDGPLLDGMLRHYRCYVDILTAHGSKYLAMDVYWKMKRNRTSRRDQLMATNSHSLYDVFLSEWIENIEAPKYLALDIVQNGAHEILNTWNKLGFKIILITMRNDRAALMQQLETTGLLEYFTDILVSSHVDGGIGKARQVLHHYPEVKQEPCLWIGDTEADVEAARYLSCAVCLLTCGLRTEAYLQSLGPELLFNHISDIDIDRIFDDRKL